MGWETGVRFSVCAEIFVFAHAFETAVEPTQHSMQWVQRAVPSTENWLIFKADDTSDEDCPELYLCFPIINCVVNNLGGSLFIRTFTASYSRAECLRFSCFKCLFA